MSEKALEENEKQFQITIRTILKFLALLCIVFVFCPSFVVSCSGQKLSLSAINVVGGIKMYGEQVAEPQFILLLCLLIPATILLLLFLKAVTDKKIAAAITVCMAFDLLIWLLFRSAVKQAAEENYCQFETLVCYFLNMIAMISQLAVSITILAGRLRLETDVLNSPGLHKNQKSTETVSQTMNQVLSSVSSLADHISYDMKKKQTKRDIIGYCAKCGKPIEYGTKFCVSCGTPVPDTMLAEAKAQKEALRKAEQEQKLREEAEKEEEARRVVENVQKRVAEQEALKLKN